MLLEVLQSVRRSGLLREAQRALLQDARQGHRQLNELGVRKPLNAGHVDFP